MAAGGSPIASPSRDSEQQWCLGFFVLSLSALLEVTLQFQPAFYTNERTVRSCHIISLLLFLSTSKAVLIANWLIQAPEQPPTDPLLPETLLGLAGCLLYPLLWGWLDSWQTSPPPASMAQVSRRMSGK